MGGSSWSKRVCALGAVALVALGAPAVQAADGASRRPPARVVDGRIDDWRGVSTGLGGTTQLSAGELVHQDHLFDDLGADTGGRAPQHGTVGAPKGDVRYPDDEARYGHNAADLLEVRLAADAESVWLLARLSTLKVADSTVVAFAFDTDGDAATGGGPWPHEAGLAVPGADVVVTLWGTGGSVTQLPGGEVTPLAEVAVETDDAHNAIEARVPRAVLGSNVRVWAASGLWDGTAWMDVGGVPAAPTRAFNVAFRDGETGSFLEERQAAALAEGDIAGFHVDVDLDALAARANAPYIVQPGRFYSVIVDQGVSVPPMHEGVSYDGTPGRFAGVGGAALAQTFDFYGRHQPYGLYIPSTYDGATPLPAALVLHGHGGSHSTYNSQPGFLRDMGEGDGTAAQPPMALITPLGRGSSFYADWGEADVLAALADAQVRLPIDPERLYLTGYSMGGYGTYRLASLYPDRFAAAVVWAGYSGEFVGAYLTDPTALVGDPTGQDAAVRDQLQPLVPAGVGGGRQGKAAIGNPVDTLENLRHLPLLHLAGTNDEIVPTPGQYAAPRRLAALGYRSAFDLYPGYEHFSFALVDDWKTARAWLGDQRRVAAPRDITYRFSDGWTAPGLVADLALEHGQAWWLRDVTMRETTEDALALASVTATSHGLTGRAVTARAVTEPMAMPTPHVRHGVVWDDGPALPLANRLDLVLAGVGALEIDSAAAGLRRCGLVLGIETDGPVTVRVDGIVVAETTDDAEVVVGCGRGRQARSERSSA